MVNADNSASEHLTGDISLPFPWVAAARSHAVASGPSVERNTVLSIEDSTPNRPRASASRAAKTPLLPSDAQRMHALQVAYKSKSAGELALSPIEDVQTISGTPIAAKFVSGARHPDTGFPRYADIDRNMASKLSSAGFLNREWRLALVDGNEYLITIDKKVQQVASRFIYELAAGAKLNDNDAVTIINRNLADLRAMNLKVIPRWPIARNPLGAVRWEKTPLDTATYAAVQAVLADFERNNRKLPAIKQMPIILGNHADGSPIAIKFIRGLKNDDTGKLRFVIFDQHVAPLLEGSDLEGFAWSVREDPGKGEVLKIMHTVSRTLARIIYELGNPGKAILPGHVIATEDGNPLNLCLDNLTLRRSNYKATQH